MWKNKHVLAALIITPILSVMAYFAVDSFVAETPHKAKAGDQVKLVEKPNCRYSSGKCGLKNGEFELVLSAQTEDNNNVTLTLTSRHSLEGVIIAHATHPEESAKPINMRPLSEDGTQWRLTINNPNIQTDRLQIAASANSAVYYGDASLTFIEYETAFNDDFRD